MDLLPDADPTWLQASIDAVDADVARLQRDKAVLVNLLKDRAEQAALKHVEKLEHELADLYMEMVGPKPSSAAEPSQGLPPTAKRSNPFAAIPIRTSRLEIRSLQESNYSRLTSVQSPRASPEGGETSSSPVQKKRKLMSKTRRRGQRGKKTKLLLDRPSTMQTHQRDCFKFDSLPTSSMPQHHPRTSLLPSETSSTDPSNTALAPYVANTVQNKPSSLAAKSHGMLSPISYDGTGWLSGHSRLKHGSRSSWPKSTLCPYWAYRRTCVQSACNMSHDPLDFVLAEKALHAEFGSHMVGPLITTPIPQDLVSSSTWIPCENFFRGYCGGACIHSHLIGDAYMMHVSARKVHYRNYKSLYTKRSGEMRRYGMDVPGREIIEEMKVSKDAWY